MARKPDWTYGHAWFTWSLVVHAGTFWRPDRFGGRGRFWTGDDAAPFWTPGHSGIDRSERFPLPIQRPTKVNGRAVRRWVCPNGECAECTRLRAAMEPPEPDAAVATDGSPRAPAATHLRLDVDLGAPHEVAVEQLDRLLMEQRKARELTERRKPPGGRDPWGFLGPVLAIDAFESNIRGIGPDEWWRDVRERPTLAAWAIRREADKSIPQVKGVLARIQQALDRNDPYFAYRYE